VATAIRLAASIAVRRSPVPPRRMVHGSPERSAFAASSMT